MNAWLCILAGGVLGSSHCLGMCGPLVLTLGLSETSRRTNLQRQLLFSAGRLFTYGCLGTLAGFAGWWAVQRQPVWMNIQGWVAVCAGLALVVVGLLSTGVWRPRTPNAVAQGCGVSALKTFVKLRGAAGAVLAGLFTGFLPCGLVYAMLALCASSANPLESFFKMVVFGLGTLPVMLLAGVGGPTLSYANRLRLIRFAAWGVVVSGAVTALRGAYCLAAAGGSDAAPCPFCS
ncbi:MAG: sulfite exporter TauE/SafE family protein [Planctomycetales bacterium]|nr:sulfite exporter TauE/SafE family protein [Planctomycetales bacterium]